MDVVDSSHKEYVASKPYQSDGSKYYLFISRQPI